MRCRTLGPVALSTEGSPLPPELFWRKNLALLIYLARSPGRTRSREHLTGLLWGDKADRAARQSLREAIWLLRKAVGEAGLTSAHDQVQLGEHVVVLDTDELERYEREGRWQAAADLVAGEFLEGFGVPDASGFEDWLAAERLAWRRRCVRVLANCSAELVAAGRLAAARDTAARALQLDAQAEQAARAMMQALALAGDRTGALEAYRRLVDALREAGRRPDDATRALGERIEAGRRWNLPEAGPTAFEVGAEARRPPLVGRGDALGKQLGAWRMCVLESRAAVGVIESDAGLGKTRLAEEIAARARLDGALVASLRAVEADQSSSWSAAFALARGLSLARGLAGASSAALATFAARLPEWAERFPAVATQPLPVGAALTGVLQAVADEQPVLVLLDDAQWFDRESLLALFGVVRDLAQRPLFVVLTVAPRAGRPELDDFRSHIGRHVPGVVVRLAPLDAAALHQLAAWAVPEYDDEDLDRLARRVAADSAGIPLLALELFHAVALGLDLGTITGPWPAPTKTLDHTLPGELPDAIVAAIRVGFRGLTAPAQQVLAAAAAAPSDRVPTELLIRMTGLAGEALHSALDELEWQRWIVAEPRGYAFVARIVREVVTRDMVTAGQRSRFREVARGA